MARLEAVEKVNRARQRMLIAEEKLRAFLENPNRQYTDVELEQRKRLANELRQAMDQYLESLLEASQS